MSIQRKIYLTASEESSGSHRPKYSSEKHNSVKQVKLRGLDKRQTYDQCTNKKDTNHVYAK